MSFRRVHLDFHTAGAIPEVGARFNAGEFQERLQLAAADSVTCFSVCHHGWSYHPTAVGRMHPQLRSDLLRSQIDAAHAIQVEVPVYVSAGANDAAALLHPEWVEVPADPAETVWGRRGPLEAGFRKLCFNTPYLDYLCRLIEEAVDRYPDADGIFLDIVLQGPCCCPKCVQGMLAAGMNPTDPAERRHFADQVLERYFAAATAATRRNNPAMRVFHNSGHFGPGWRDRLHYFSHLELESLPTGGWGYDHFLQTAAYAETTGMEYAGMTGKFHSSWGEFGGFKHPNALRYECATMLAVGARCSIGDQLHPSGELNHATCRLIGNAYREVAAKASWCDATRKCAEIALLTREGFAPAAGAGDIGAARILLESHLQFDIIAPDHDFAGYPLVILPDAIPVGTELAQRLREYLAHGGKLLLSGTSALAADGHGFWLNIGAEDRGAGEYDPTYLLPEKPFQPDFCDAAFVVYGPARRLRVTDGEILSRVANPYFNRDFRHFCSHQHAPDRLDRPPEAAAVRYGNAVYLAHALFGIYHDTGAVTLRQHLEKILFSLLPERLVKSNLPSEARIMLRRQPDRKRRILHLLYANKVVRGGDSELPHFRRPIPVIEELLPLRDCRLEIRLPQRPSCVRLVPQQQELAFRWEDGRCIFDVAEFSCHQMVEITDAD